MIRITWNLSIQCAREALIIALVVVNLTVLVVVMIRLGRTMEDLRNNCHLEAMKTEIREDITELRMDIKDVTNMGLQTSRGLTSMRKVVRDNHDAIHDDVKRISENTD